VPGRNIWYYEKYMQYKVVVDRMILKLAESGFGAEAQRLRYVSGSAVMSIGELLGSILDELKAITKDNTHILKLISDDLNEFKNYCRVMGMKV
jgi:hypothetical protein